MQGERIIPMFLVDSYKYRGGKCCWSTLSQSPVSTSSCSVSFQQNKEKKNNEKKKKRIRRERIRENSK